MAQPDEAREPSKEDLEREAHLLDIGNFELVVQFVATAVATGVIGSAAWELLQSKVRAFRKRFGDKRTRELEEEIYRELAKVRRKSHLSNEDLRLRARHILEKIFQDGPV